METASGRGDDCSLAPDCCGAITESLGTIRTRLGPAALGPGSDWRDWSIKFILVPPQAAFANSGGSLGAFLYAAVKGSLQFFFGLIEDRADFLFAIKPPAERKLK